MSTISVVQDGSGDARLRRLVRGIGQDLRFTIRAMRATPVVFAIVIASLGLGIGANTAIFSVVNSLLLRPLPVRDPDRLAMLADAGRESPAWSYAIWEQVRSRSNLFDGAFAWAFDQFNLTRSGEARFIEGLWASGEFFEVLGVQATSGRTFTRSDDRRGGGPDGPVAVISYDFWRRHFGGAPDAIGRSLVLDSVPFTVIAVTPASFFGPDVGRRFDVVVPINTEPLLRGENSSVDRRGRFWLRIMLRRRADQSVDAAATGLRAVQHQIREVTRPEGPQGSAEAFMTDPFTLTPAATGRSQLRDRYGEPLMMLMIVVAAVLVIACVNIANLLLARAVARRHEMSLRRALGASSAHLMRLLFTEAAVLAAVGALVGFTLSEWIVDLLVRQLSTQNTFVFLDLTPDWRVFTFATGVTVATALAFAIIPAWWSLRAEPAGALQEQGRGPVAGGRCRLAGTLVTLQIALSLTVVVAAGLFVRTFAGLAFRDVGFEPERVLIVNVSSSTTRHTPQQLVPLYERLRGAVAAVPGVQRAALSDITPLSASSRMTVVETPGRPPVPEPDRMIFVNVISPEWFETYGIRLLRGRSFATADQMNTPRVAIVNRAFADRFFKGEDPIGHTLATGAPGQMRPLEIVGLVENTVYDSLREPSAPTMFTPTTQRSTARPAINVNVRSASDSPALLSRAIEAAIQDVDPALVLRFRSLSSQLDDALNQERLVALLSGFFGILALFIAGLGLYGMTAYAVSRRRAEIALRVALGATRAGVIRLVMVRVAVLITAGVAIGALLSLWASPLVATLVWGVDARDPGTFVGAAAILAIVGILAGWLPVRRALTIDPAALLRE